MKTLNTIQDLRGLVNNNNYYYKDNEFSDPFYLIESADEYFKSFVSGDSNHRMEGFFIDKVKTEKYFVDEVNATVTVDFYEAYVDSGANAEDYFYGFIINY